MATLVNFFGKPLFWAWAFVAVWSTHVGITLAMERWEGLTISLIGLLAAGLVVSAIYSRRHKRFYPHDNGGNHERDSSSDKDL